VTIDNTTNYTKEGQKYETLLDAGSIYDIVRDMNWRKVVQLALVHVGVSITVVPVTSTLNRIMIADMGLSAFLVGLLISLPYLLSPLQVAIGNWADHHAIWGHHRSPWIVIGGLMAAFGSYMTAHTVHMIPENFTVGFLLSVLVFAIWGMGVNIASVSYLSLLNELSADHPAWRSRAISFMWTAMILSTIGISQLLSNMLVDYSVDMLYSAFGVVWLVATLFILMGAAGLETVSSNDIKSERQNSATHPLAAFRLVVANQAARRFFIYLLLVLVSIHAQDVLLEPFGAEALDMSVSMTSRLTSIWGAGFFITLVGGLSIMSRLGRKRSANIGAAVAALGFALIIAGGLLGMATFFMLAVLILGLGGGLMTVSNLSFMLDMTVPQAAGLYIGAWGVANFAGQGLGNIISGLLRDSIYQLTGSSIAGYVTVFGLEIIGLLVAILLFRSISVEAFREEAVVKLDEILVIGS